MDLCQQSDVSAFLYAVKVVTAFLSRSKCLLISWLQSPTAVILEPKKIKSVTVSTFSLSICHEVMEKTLESPLDYKEIQLAHSEGDQPWDFFGGNDAEAETQYFGHLVRRVDSLEKTLMLGGIGGKRRR